MSIEKLTDTNYEDKEDTYEKSFNYYLRNYVYGTEVYPEVEPEK